MLEGVLSVLLWGAPTVGTPEGVSSHGGGTGRYDSWERAEDARRMCCPGQAQCSAPIPDAERCYLAHADTIFDDYRRAFDQSQATNLDALRRCEEVADRVIEQLGQRLGRPPCAAGGDVKRACDAKHAEGGCNRRKLGLSSPVWWQPLLYGANLADAGEHIEARARFADAYELYLTSTGRDGRFLEAWYILRESVRSQFSACGVDCSPGQLRLGEQLAELNRLFERFHQGCHASAVPEVRQVCEERNMLRGEHAITLVRTDGLYVEAAELLEAAYGDCAALIGPDDPRRSEQVLRCWRAYGRRSVWLRESDSKAGRPAPQQVQKARTLVNDFIRDMQRECDSSTRQVEVGDACTFLRSSVQPGVTGKNEAPSTLARPIVLAPLSMTAKGSAPEDLLDTPLFDLLLSPSGLAVGDAGGIPQDMETSISTQTTQRQAAGVDCSRITSSVAFSICTSGRILHGARDIITRAASATAEKAPSPSVRVRATNRWEASPCRRCRAGAAAALSIGAVGAVAALVGASVGASAEQRQHAYAVEHSTLRADELRVSRYFELGEAMNRVAVGGLVVAGTGVIVGTAVLIADAVGRKRARSRLRAGVGGLLVAF